MGIIARITQQPAERIAIKAGASEISFGRLIADVDSAAARLREQGIGEGSRVGLRAGLAENGHSYANWVAHLAAIQVGASHVSMTDKASIRAALQAGRLDYVVGTLESLIDIPLSVRRIQFHVDPGAPSPVSGPIPNEEDKAHRLNLTSGTTGKPKFVTWDSATIERRVDQVAEGGLVGAETRLFPLLHLRTTAGFRYPLAVWASGGCVLLPLARKGLERDRDAMPHANLITCSPPQLRERLQGLTGNWPGKEGRTIMLLGGRLPAALRQEALARACSKLLISYGATETGSIATGEHVLIDRHPGAVGFLRPGVDVEILGAEGERVPAGMPGIIRTRSPHMSSYAEGSKAEDAGHFADGWFHPGDVGRLYEDGLLAIEGRVGDTLNLGGWKISANDLEAKVAEISGVLDVCAVAMQLPEGDRLAFGIVCSDELDVGILNERIRAMIAKRRPFHLVRMKAIPRNAMGKIPRALIASQLAALYGAARKNAANA